MKPCRASQHWGDDLETPQEKARAYLDIAHETYMQEIAPSLPKEKRYAGAMIASALAVAQRRLSHADPAHDLLEATGASDLDRLAKAIRSGEITDETRKSLAADLMAYVEAELAITNPKFLERRKKS